MNPPDEPSGAFRLFEKALDYPPTRRRSFLSEQCGENLWLRKEVEALLAADEMADGFLEPVVNEDHTDGIMRRRLGHYRLDHILGSGGMGQVYLAYDSALDRPAALKILPESYAPWQKQRLVEEAQANSHLQHPAIATYFESGESDGLAFIAMEYVPGPSLRKRLFQEPIQWQNAIGLISCLLEGLAHAHAANLLHRDIKPENIIVTGIHSGKLLDFGLAKSILRMPDPDDAESSNSTSESFGAGTPGYMSPEQILGLQLGPSSDLFGMGAVLYETITGRRAFPNPRAGLTDSKNQTRFMDAFLVPGIPEALQKVILRALEPALDQRYQTAADMLSDLRNIREGTAFHALPHSVTVLDFSNRTGLSNMDWVGAGIAESLATDLSSISGIQVIPMIKCRETCRDLRKRLQSEQIDRQAGLAQGTRWVLTGSFHGDEEKMTIHSELMFAPTGELLAGSGVEGPISEFFRLGEELATNVVQSLNLSSCTPRMHPELEAYELYERAEKLVHTTEKGGLDQAIELLEKATKIDPAFPLPWVGLAAVFALRFTYSTNLNDLECAARYASQAVAADPQLAEPLVWLGYCQMRQEQWEEAIGTEKSAMQLDPRNFLAPYFVGTAMEWSNRPTEAIPFYQKSVQLNPVMGMNCLGLGWCHFQTGHYREAEWCLRRTSLLERQGKTVCAGSDGFLAEFLQYAGRPEEARIKALQGLKSVEGSDFIYRDTFRAVCLCAFGRASLRMKDFRAAEAAFLQATQLLRGRSTTLGGGHLMVQAMAGLARSRRSPMEFQNACSLLEKRAGFSFHSLWTCTEPYTLAELARTARNLGLPEQARQLAGRARMAFTTP